MKVLIVFAATIVYFITLKYVSARQNYHRIRRDPIIPYARHHNHEVIGWPHQNIPEPTHVSPEDISDSSSSDSDSDYHDHGFGHLARQALNDRLYSPPVTNQAKNVIIFSVEDLPHYTIRMAKLKKICFGHVPCVDEFDYDLTNYFNGLARVKSGCYDSFEPDRACLATAILTGSKSNKGTIALNPSVQFEQSEYNADHKLESIARWAQLAGKRTGVVTTDLITSPTVSPYYGHSSNYLWQSDYDMAQDGVYEHGADLASQLIHGETGSNLNVIFGGGRRKFLPAHKYNGERLDRSNLLKQWIKSKHGQGEFSYIEHRDSLPKVCKHTEYILGLFDMDKLNHEHNPTLAELTAAAITLLDKDCDDKGFVLFVQSTKLNTEKDYSDVEVNLRHHLEFREAAKVAIAMTDLSDTLIVALSDHHYRPLPEWSDEEMEFELGYIGEHDQLYRHRNRETRIRKDISYPSDWGYHVFGTRVTALYGIYEKQLELWRSHHCDIRDTGDESGVFAYGTFSHLFSGTIDQNYIPHFIGYAACIGDGLQMCDS